MTKSKHKLSGYAIKGDGTQETAERIRKVFEADGVNCCDWCFEFDQYYGVDGDTAVPAGKHLRVHKLIPLTEAERIVFGDELKVGMKVVLTDEAKSCYWYKPGVHEIERGESLGCFYVSGGIRTISKYWLRRATITDFLRTLPSGIAERALRQVDEEYEFYGKYPHALTNAVASFADWEKTEEGYRFWLQVGQGDYDRARAILAEKDRVGKWWKGPNDSMCRCTRTDEKGNLYGYGVSQFGEWYDDDECIAIASSDVKGLTPATPEEVEAMLDKQRVKMGFVEGAVVKSAMDGQIHALDSSKVDFKLNGCGEFTWFAVDETMVFYNGKWAEIITTAPEKPEPKSGKQWIMIPTKGDECIVVWIEDGGLKYKFEKAVELNGCTTVQIDTNEPQPTDKFPRVMWVWDDKPKKAKRATIEKYCDSYCPWQAKWDIYRYASDTHPVTGEPAVKKDVVEQIREVVENDFTTDFYKVNEIKEILTKNEK